MLDKENFSITTQVLLAVIVQTVSETEARKAATVFDIPVEEINRIILTPQAIIDKEGFLEQQLDIIKETVKIVKQANKAVHLENKDKDRFIRVYQGNDSKILWKT